MKTLFDNQFIKDQLQQSLQKQEDKPMSDNTRGT